MRLADESRAPQIDLQQQTNTAGGRRQPPRSCLASRSWQPAPRRIAVRTTSTALALLAIALAACGGDDEPQRPSKAQYVRQANAICAAANERVEPLLREHLMKRPPTARDVAAFAGAVVPIERETLAKLRDIPAPAGDASTVARIYDAATRATDTLLAGRKRSSPGHAHPRRRPVRRVRAARPSSTASLRAAPPTNKGRPVINEG